MHQEFADYFCLFLDCSFWLIVAWNVVFARNGFVVAPLPNKFLSLVFRTFGLIIHFDSSCKFGWLLSAGVMAWLVVLVFAFAFARCLLSMEDLLSRHVTRWWRGGCGCRTCFLVTCAGAASPEASLCWVQSRASQNRRSPPPNWSFFLRFELL